jgi:alkylhydroperoxidase family enzyme
MHANEARKDGEQQHRLDVLPAWREVDIFSARERAALAWTEALTRLADQGVSDASFTQVAEHFSEKEIVNLSAAIATINAWNRIAVGFNFVPNF